MKLPNLSCCFSPCSMIIRSGLSSHSNLNEEMTQFNQKEFKIYDCYLYWNERCGWGVYAKKIIPKHSLIEFYAGELITSIEARRRYQSYDEKVCLSIN